MDEKRCKSCKHWVPLCEHGEPHDGYCYRCDDDASPTMQGPKGVGAKRGHCMRGDSDGLDPDDETTLMWGGDGSEYEGRVYTKPEFGCVMWEKKNG